MNAFRLHKKLYLLLVSVCCACLLCSCGTARAVTDTAALFANIDLKKYTICDTSGQFTSGTVVSAYKIMSEQIDIEYYILPTVAQAKKAFENNRANFQQAVPALGESATSPSDQQEAVENIPYYEDTASGSNFERYCLITEDYYYVVSRVETSLVYIVTERKNLKDANRFLKDINYY